MLSALYWPGLAMEMQSDRRLCGDLIGYLYFVFFGAGTVRECRFKVVDCTGRLPSYLSWLISPASAACGWI